MLHKSLILECDKCSATCVWNEYDYDDIKNIDHDDLDAVFAYCGWGYSLDRPDFLHCPKCLAQAEDRRERETLKAFGEQYACGETPMPCNPGETDRIADEMADRHDQMTEEEFHSKPFNEEAETSCQEQFPNLTSINSRVNEAFEEIRDLHGGADDFRYEVDQLIDDLYGRLIALESPPGPRRIPIGDENHDNDTCGQETPTNKSWTHCTKAGHAYNPMDYSECPYCKKDDDPRSIDNLWRTIDVMRKRLDDHAAKNWNMENDIINLNFNLSEVARLPTHGPQTK